MSESCELTEEQVELLKKRISGWLRQSRYRARKSNVDVDVKYCDIIDIYEELNYRCAYCDQPAGSPDHPFPIKEKGPCVSANIVPCCDECRSKKKNRGLVKFYQEGHIDQDRLHSTIRDMLKRRGSDIIKRYLKGTFLGDQDATT
jgi:hypothetical protein